MTLKGFIVGTAITAIAFYVLTEFLPQVGVTYEGELIGLVVLAVIFGVVNGLIGPIIKAFALPLTIWTMGLAGLLINAALLLITAFVGDAVGFSLTVGDFPPDLTAWTIVSAVLGSIVLSVVGTAARLVVPD
jgi:putative membrane protein